MTRSPACERSVQLLRPLAALLLPVAMLGGAEGPPVHSHRPQAVIEGIVLSVGRDTLALQEQTTNAIVAFAVASYAAIRKDGELTSLGQLRPGDVAQVVTDTDGRGYKAIGITVETPPAKR